MVALILKDIYNLKKYMLSMCLMVFVVGLISQNSSSVQSVIPMGGIIFGMMIFTTFSFDDMSNWTKYALVTPVTKKDIVKAKFIVLLILSFIGIIYGLLVTLFIDFFITKSLTLENVGIYLIITLLSFSISEIFGSVAMPLVYKFGAEKARNLLLLSYLIPVGVGFAILKIIEFLKITISIKMIVITLFSSPIIALIWSLIMYLISYYLFKKQDI